MLSGLHVLSSTDTQTVSAHSKPSKQDNAHTRPASRWHMQGVSPNALVASATVLKARARSGKARQRPQKPVQKPCATANNNSQSQPRQGKERRGKVKKGKVR